MTVQSGGFTNRRIERCAYIYDTYEQIAAIKVSTKEYSLFAGKGAKKPGSPYTIAEHGYSGNRCNYCCALLFIGQPLDASR